MLAKTLRNNVGCMSRVVGSFNRVAILTTADSGKSRLVANGFRPVGIKSLFDRSFYSSANVRDMGATCESWPNHQSTRFNALKNFESDFKRMDDASYDVVDDYRKLNAILDYLERNEPADLEQQSIVAGLRGKIETLINEIDALAHRRPGILSLSEGPSHENVLKKIASELGVKDQSGNMFPTYFGAGYSIVSKYAK